MIQEKNNKSEEEKWDTISLFFAYIPKSLYISMYKEGDAVKKYATRIHGKKLISLLLLYALIVIMIASILTSFLHTMK
ncbi:stage II sporulation protein P, partial [Bacillus thuringiensis]|nr:stage II sporulation protein P [Bacillus thuringiensis]